MSADTTTIDSILKIDYLDPIIDTLNNKNFLLHIMEKTSEYTSGKQAYIPLHVSRNEGIGARAEGGTLPTSGQQGYDNAVYNMTYQYGAIKISGPSIAASRENDGAFAQVLDAEVQGMTRDLARDQNRQAFSGKAGTLCTVDIAPDDTVDSVTTTVNQFATLDGRFLQKGRRLQFHNPSGLAARNSTALVISSVARVQGASGATYWRVTCTASVDAQSVAADDLVVRFGNQGFETWGLEDMVNADNPDNIGSVYVGGINRDTSGFEFWQSNEIDHNNAAFGDSLFRDMIDTVDKEGDGELDVFMTTFEIYNAYANSLLVDRRFNTSGTRFERMDGAWDMLDYSGIPVVKDRDCQPNHIWGLDTSRLKMLHMSDWDWMDRDGSVLTRSSNEDAYEATIFKYCEGAITDPKDCIVAKNVGAANAA
jgi:hypothetical protein